jgi:hypothetical protein
MLVEPDDLSQDTIYLRDKMRRHNRLLHGWGVVCGCNVRPALDAAGVAVPWCFKLETGCCLGPYGDDIVVPAEATLDVRKVDVEGNLAAACGEPSDPWCAEVVVPRPAGELLYLAIRYDECLSRPIRSLDDCGCGCGDQDCQYSRVRDGYALKLLRELPANYRQATSHRSGYSCSTADWPDGVRPCPPCPESPWVVLADVTPTQQGALTIDPVQNRRYVGAHGEFGFFCA